MIRAPLPRTMTTSTKIYVTPESEEPGVFFATLTVNGEDLYGASYAGHDPAHVARRCWADALSHAREHHAGLDLSRVEVLGALTSDGHHPTIGWVVDGQLTEEPRSE